MRSLSEPLRRVPCARLPAADVPRGPRWAARTGPTGSRSAGRCTPPWPSGCWTRARLTPASPPRPSSRRSAPPQRSVGEVRWRGRPAPPARARRPALCQGRRLGRAPAVCQRPRQMPPSSFHLCRGAAINKANVSPPCLVRAWFCVRARWVDGWVGGWVGGPATGARRKRGVRRRVAERGPGPGAGQDRRGRALRRPLQGEGPGCAARREQKMPPSPSRTTLGAQEPLPGAVEACAVPLCFLRRSCAVVLVLFLCCSCARAAPRLRLLGPYLRPLGPLARRPRSYRPHVPHTARARGVHRWSRGPLSRLTTWSAERCAPPHGRSPHVCAPFKTAICTLRVGPKRLHGALVCFLAQHFLPFFFHPPFFLSC